MLCEMHTAALLWEGDLIPSDIETYTLNVNIFVQRKQYLKTTTKSSSLFEFFKKEVNENLHTKTMHKRKQRKENTRTRKWKVKNREENMRAHPSKRRKEKEKNAMEN